MREQRRGAPGRRGAGGVAADPIQRELAVAVHRRQRVQDAGGRAHVPGATRFDDHPPDAGPGERGGIGPGQQQVLHRPRAVALAGDDDARDGEVATAQHVGAHPAGVGRLPTERGRDGEAFDDVDHHRPVGPAAVVALVDEGDRVVRNLAADLFGELP